MDSKPAGLIPSKKFNITPEQTKILNESFGEHFEHFFHFFDHIETEIDKNGYLFFSAKSVLEYISAAREEKCLPELSQETINLILNKEILEGFIAQKCDVSSLKVNMPKKDEKSTQAFYMVNPSELQNSNAGKILADRLKWEAYKSAIEHSGAKVIEIFGGNPLGNHAETWTRDLGVKIGDTYYCTPPSNSYNMYWNNHDENAKQFKQYFNKYDPSMKILEIKGDCFEGGQVIVDEKTKTVIFGYNTQLPAEILTKQLKNIDFFEKFVNKTQDSYYTFIKAGLKSSHAYHLDLALSEPLPNGEILIHEESFTPESLEKLRDAFPGRLIPISTSDAEKMATNLVISGNTLIMMSTSVELKKKLCSLGYEVNVPFPSGNNDIGEGGIHCLTQPLPAQFNR